jgi:hypothetical protein
MAMKLRISCAFSGQTRPPARKRSIRRELRAALRPKVSSAIGNSVRKASISATMGSIGLFILELSPAIAGIVKGVFPRKTCVTNRYIVVAIWP